MRKSFSNFVKNVLPVSFNHFLLRLIQFVRSLLPCLLCHGFSNRVAIATLSGFDGAITDV